MALFVTGMVFKEYGRVPKNSSRFYISVPSSHLSEACELIEGDKIRGKILKVKLEKEEFPELKDKTIKLIFRKGAIYDQLFISKKDWEDNFRDYGLVKPGYWIELKLDEAVLYTGETVKLYPKRDVKVS